MTTAKRQVKAAHVNGDAGSETATSDLRHLLVGFARQGHSGALTLMSAIQDSDSVDWIAPLSTTIGAVVGVGSSLTVDRFRSRREANSKWVQARREVYVDYLTALSKAHSNMRSTTFRVGLAGQDRFGALHDALDDSGVWRLRQTISLVAPAEVISLAVEAGRALETVRDSLIAEVSVGSDRYLRARADLWMINAALRQAMRDDLEVGGMPDPEVGQYRYDNGQPKVNGSVDSSEQQTTADGI